MAHTAHDERGIFLLLVKNDRLSVSRNIKGAVARINNV